MVHYSNLTILIVIALCQCWTFFIHKYCSMGDSFIGKIQCFSVCVAQLVSVVYFLILLFRFV